MSVSTHIVGQRNRGGKLGDMLDLKELCDKLQIHYPPELMEYFKGTAALASTSRESALQMATEVDLDIEGLAAGSVEYGDGAVIDLTKLPDDIKRLRIYME